MKKTKTITIVLLTVLLFSCNQRIPQYTINGIFKDGIGELLILEDVSDKYSIKTIDSMRVDANGNFSFSGSSFGEKKEIRLSIAGTRFKDEILIEDTIVNVNIVQKVITEKYTKSIFKVERSKEDALYAKLKANYKERRTIWGGKTNGLVVANKEKKISDEELAKACGILDADFITEILDTLSNYPNNYATAFYIKNYMLGFDPLPSVEEAFNNLADNIKNSKEAIPIISGIEVIKKSYVGGLPDDFSIPSLDGGETSLYQYRGKVLLIDCWATWCGPCIKEMPHIGEIYNEFHSKGLEVLGISYDRDETKWRNFLKKNEYVVWEQASSLKEWNCPSAKIFSVNTIPETILIDKNGVIAARGLKGDKLKAKIKELLVLE
ncbi:TlpA family protein disulfide reductase [Flavivirga jejuensis]|uniref:TlpA disulfide reductase family protein n=1 Tax=Flavivirga jejuensis TaxID=870487 RepID=A0ABT8WKU3_9FLAO|nr:TlpA disulfide reductase family protein [Flavivirga jejuensis]MDO5973775.1 TlpA disulfide reductase family protein [Flavivirga jejuensis]